MNEWKIILILLSFIISLTESKFSCNPEIFGICVINYPINVKGNISIQEHMRILIVDTQISCQPPCSIEIKSNLEITIQNSSLYASSIFIFSDDQMEIFNSVLSTNGTIAMGKGYTNHILEGFGYAGMGAFCIRWEDVNDNSYGPNCATYEDLNELTISDTQGSGGIRYFEKGGGRIVIKTNTNLLLRKSNITASGYPSNENLSLCEAIANQPYSKGGTGGFILIEAEEIQSSGDPTRIHAQGGYYCDFGWGGSGGKINIVSNSIPQSLLDSLLIEVSGGRNLTANEEFCSNGAIGTLCLKEKSGTTLIIDGKFASTLTPTIIQPQNLILINEIKIINNALCSFSMIKDGNYTGNNLEIIDSNFEDFVHPNESISLELLNFQSIEIIRSKAIFHQNIQNFVAQNFFLDVNSSFIFEKSIHLSSNKIVIDGKISASLTPSSTFLIESSEFTVSPTGNISDIEYIAIYAEKNFLISGTVRSFKQTCTYNLFSPKIFFNFADSNLTSSSIEEHLDQWIKNKNLTLNESKWFTLFKEILISNYTVVIVSSENLLLEENGLIEGARIGVFSKNAILERNTKITTTGYGCSTDSGPGKGQSILHEERFCGGMGGSYGGYKGYGLGVILENDSQSESVLCQSYARQIDSKEENLPYGGLDDVSYEGSGGGSGAEIAKDKINNRGGSGGGIIVMGIFQNLINDGSIESNGQSTSEVCNFNTRPGAGSGGSIQIFLRFLMGFGNITTLGGNSGFYCGEGGGGRIKIYFLNWFDESIKEKFTADWKGNIFVNAGSRQGVDLNYSLDINKFKGSKGTIFVSPCLRGYYPNPLCKRCDNDTYKDNIGDGECKVCTNKPSNSIYKNQKFENAFCEYVCNNGIDGKKYQGCENNFSIYSKYILNYYGGVCLFILGLILFLGYFYRKYKKQKKNSIYDKLINFEETTGKISSLSVISEELKREDNFSVADLLYHVHRIYVYGTNRYDNRWYINPEPQQEIEYLVSYDKYKRFVEIFNKHAKWGRCLGIILRIISIMYYPLYWFLLQKIRKKKCGNLRSLVKMPEYFFWRIRDLDDMAQIKIKMSISDDMTLCFLDIFNYKSSSLKYFTLSCPFTIMLAGEGNFFKPYSLNLTDPFLKCLYFAINKNKENQIRDREKIHDFLVSPHIRDENISELHAFFKRFNKLASNIDFAALDYMFYNALENLAECLRFWNIKFFQRFGFRVDILVLQVPKERFLNEQNSVTLLENKDKVMFKNFSKNIHRVKTLYSSYDIRFSLFIFDIEQDFQKLDNERISFMHDDEEGMPWSSNHPNKSICSEEDFYAMKEEIKRKNYFENLKYPIIEMNQKNYVEASIKRHEMKILKFLRRYLALIRFVFMSHKKARFGKRVTHVFVFLLMILDSFILFIICLNVFFDYFEDQLMFALFYPGAIFLGPLTGCLWISSGSYNIGKIFLMFNYMALMNCILNLLISIPDQRNGFIQYSIKATAIIFKIFLSYFGSAWIPHLKKHDY